MSFYNVQTIAFSRLLIMKYVFQRLCWPHRQYRLRQLRSHFVPMLWVYTYNRVWYVPANITYVSGGDNSGNDASVGVKFVRNKQYMWGTESRDSVVGIATRNGLEGPGIESRWGEIFRTYSDRVRGPPSLLYNGYRVFPGGKGGWGVMLITHPLLVSSLRKLKLYLHSPYGSSWACYGVPFTCVRNRVIKDVGIF
jgi:hypothetical protein